MEGRLLLMVSNSGCVRRLIAPVRYAPPSDLLLAAKNFDPIFKATWPSWLMRPYLSKLPGYRYEQEIRFVFGAHPAITKEANGVLIKIDISYEIKGQIGGRADSIQTGDPVAIV